VKLTDIAKMAGVQGGHLPLLAGEAHAIWRFLTLRYTFFEFTQLVSNYIEDTEFKAGVVRGVSSTLQRQIRKTEELLNAFGIPLPPKPPKSVSAVVKSETMRDETIYRMLLIGIQYFQETHTEIQRMMNDDKLRNLFMGWMKEEMKMYDLMVKYGKMKGWYWSAPQYKH